MSDISNDLQREPNDDDHHSDEDGDDDGERQREEERCAANGNDINREMEPTGIAVRAEIIRTFEI